jgi:hypothetical protein
MDLFTAVKNGNKSLSHKRRLHKKGEAQRALKRRFTEMTSERNGSLLYNVKRRMVLSLQRIFKRGTWLSIQCFSLASLYNLYLAVLEAQSEQMRQKKIMKFTATAPILLQRYRTPVYRQYRKSFGREKSQKPTLRSIERAAAIVYEELQDVHRLCQRRLQWKRIRERARTLIRG